MISDNIRDHLRESVSAFLNYSRAEPRFFESFPRPVAVSAIGRGDILVPRWALTCHVKSLAGA